MAGVVFSLALSLTATRAVLVLDAVYSAARGTALGAVARATQAITSSSPQSARRRLSSTGAPNAGSASRVRSGLMTCSRGLKQQVPTPSSSHVIQPKLCRMIRRGLDREKNRKDVVFTIFFGVLGLHLLFNKAFPERRILHSRLLAMHFAAMLTMGAGMAKYMLPASDTSCLITHRVMISTILLYDASLVLFLLAKTSVTNGNRILAKWETVITWWSRFYAWVYLPMSAVFLAVRFPGAASEKGNYCYNRFVEEGKRTEFVDTLGFSSNNAMLIVQFVLLLAMFVKPLRTNQGSTQSGGAVYRRVVIKNVVCTSGIICTYVITTLVVVLALISDPNENNKADQVADVTPSANILLTLCLTEIALPLGFSSCVKSVKAHSGVTLSQSKQRQMSGATTYTKRQAGGTTQRGSVKMQQTARLTVPIEETAGNLAETEVMPFGEGA